MSDLKLNFIQKLQLEIDVFLNKAYLTSRDVGELHAKMTRILRGHVVVSVTSIKGRAQQKLIIDVGKLGVIYTLLKRIETYPSRAEDIRGLLIDMNIFIQKYFTAAEVRIPIFLMGIRNQLERDLSKRERTIDPDFIQNLRNDIHGFLSITNLNAQKIMEKTKSIREVMWGHETMDGSSLTGLAQISLMKDINKLEVLSNLLERTEASVTSSKNIQNIKALLTDISSFIQTYYREEDAPQVILTAQAVLQQTFMKLKHALPSFQFELENSIKIAEELLETLRKQETQIIYTLDTSRFLSGPLSGPRIEELKKELEDITERIFKLEHQLVLDKIALGTIKGQSGSVNLETILLDLKNFVLEEENTSRKRLFQKTSPVKKQKKIKTMHSRRLEKDDIIIKTTLDVSYKEQHDGHLMEDQYKLLLMHNITDSFLSGNDEESMIFIDGLKKIMTEIESLEIAFKHDNRIIKELQKEALRKMSDIMPYIYEIRKIQAIPSYESIAKFPKSVAKALTYTEKGNRLRALFKKRDAAIKAFNNVYENGVKKFNVFWGNSTYGFFYEFSHHAIHRDFTGAFKTMIKIIKQKKRQPLKLFYKTTDELTGYFKRGISRGVEDMYGRIVDMIEIYASSYRVVDEEQISKIIIKLSAIMYTNGISTYGLDKAAELQKWMTKANDVREFREKLALVVRQVGGDPFAMLGFIMNQADWKGLSDQGYRGLPLKTLIALSLLVGIALEFDRQFKNTDLTLLSEEDNRGHIVDKLTSLWDFVNHMNRYASRFRDDTDITLFMEPIDDLIIKWALSLKFEVFKIEVRPTTQYDAMGIIPSNFGRSNIGRWEGFLWYFIHRHTHLTDKSSSNMTNAGGEYVTYKDKSLRYVRKAGRAISEGSPSNQFKNKKFKNRLLAMIALGFLRVERLTTRELFFTLTDLWSMVTKFLSPIASQSEFVEWVKHRINVLAWWTINRINESLNRVQNMTVLVQLEADLNGFFNTQTELRDRAELAKNNLIRWENVWGTMGKKITRLSQLDIEIRGTSQSKDAPLSSVEAIYGRVATTRKDLEAFEKKMKDKFRERDEARNLILTDQARVEKMMLQKQIMDIHGTSIPFQKKYKDLLRLILDFKPRQPMPEEYSYSFSSSSSDDDTSSLETSGSGSENGDPSDTSSWSSADERRRPAWADDASSRDDWTSEEEEEDADNYAGTCIVSSHLQSTAELIKIRTRLKQIALGRSSSNKN